MANNSLKSKDCAIAQALSVIGEWWTLMILRDLFIGVHTFDEFQEDLGISTSVLSARLKTLMEAGVVERRVQPHDKRSFKYHLTELGHELYPVIVGLWQWGERLCPGENGQRLEIRDKATNRPIVGAVVLSQDGAHLSSREAEPVPGVGASEKFRAWLSKGEFKVA